MKKIIITISILALTLASFGQYTEDKLPSGLTISTSIGDADYMILQKDGESNVKATRMDTIRSYMTVAMTSNVESLDSVSGSTGQFIISDGTGWLSPISAKYEGSGAYSFGYRKGTVGWGSFVIGGFATIVSPSQRNTASGIASFASGIGTVASGDYSYCGGVFCVSSGNSSFNGSGGSNTVSGKYAFNGSGNKNTVIGNDAFNGGGDSNTVSGEYAFNGSGGSNTVSGEYSFNGSGSSNTVSGYDSFNGSGKSNTVSGNGSFNGIGLNNTVSGDGSFNGGGFNNYAQSYSETTIGLFNDTAATHTATSYVATDRLLTIGNGTSTSAMSNALVMLKNGNTTATGDWTIDGDLTVTGMTNAETIPHMFAYFGDSTVIYTFAATDTWYHLTNATDSIYIYDEMDEFTVSNDTITFGAAGDYNLDFHLSFMGGNQDVYAVRFYNVTQGVGIPTGIAQTAQGASDIVSLTIIAYAEVALGDEIIMQIKCNTTDAATLKSSVIRLQYIHD